jgi:hypothetical protein
MTLPTDLRDYPDVVAQALTQLQGTTHEMRRLSRGGGKIGFLSGTSCSEPPDMVVKAPKRHARHLGR